MATQFPTLDEVLSLHEELIRRFGGQSGARDLGLLESALNRPQTGYYDTLSMQAAALMQSLAMNHPFIDGNKRVAFSVTAIFLRMNGWRLVTDADEGERFLVETVIKERAELETMAAWIERHLEPVKK